MVRVEVDGDGVALLTLCRADARNALSRALVTELDAAIADVSARVDVRAVIVVGEGTVAFCAGADLKERATMSDDDVRAFLTQLGGTLVAIEASPKPFVAAVNGAALGGGLELALACDIRVASNTATLGLPEVRLGIIPGAGGTQRLPRVVGEAAALRLVLTGARLDAESARSVGLISEVAPPDELVGRARAIGREIALGAPLAIAAAKRAVRGAAQRPLADGLAAEREEYETLIPTRDRVEALAAFAERRPPRFEGR
ncbi:MAG: enoyl-CoA hydratase/isomerase family protein [Myxococcales bacterium]|nr:enoyl-CoA hydratase/isomerase family protein [Myxococcales bacterium]MCB9532438.1 enoyl-CoA hydratase/isomerase family protein [Myxococcales bacterium]MCB9533520.1 enoyl-CoA hydratase/isomerase family protein [Myxococcales bacterium]